MLIAHLPAGYLLAKATRSRGALFAGLIVGSVLPDLDMLWFAFVDGGTVHHHEYLTHRPLIWAAIALVAVVIRKPFLIGVGCGGVFHLALDSIAGRITWGWPIWDHATTLTVVPATHDHWVASFLNHWTFKIELAIVFVAVCIFLYSWKRGHK